MNMLVILIPLSLLLVVVAVWAFLWAVGSGQFDDLDTPGWDILSDASDQTAHSESTSHDSVHSECLSNSPSDSHL